MKKVIIILLVCAMIAGVVIFYPKQQTTYLRIHIRANSDIAQDQEIKYEIKDLVCEYLTPLFLDCRDTKTAKDILSHNLNNIENIIDSYLIKKGFTYLSRAKINNEYFPTRSYKDLVLDSGYYDALTVDLGEGRGDNWWCVIYPPMCFADNTKNIVYKSKLLQIINQIFCKE